MAVKRALSFALALGLATVSVRAAAEPCNVPGDCASGFCVDQVCCDAKCDMPCEACTAAKKGGGMDGTCGPMPAGAVCDPPHCDGATFSFVDTSTCDDMGTCVAPQPVSCLVNDPCKFDLCGDSGCEHVTKNDGTDCGGGKVCTNGMCGSSMASSTGASSGSGGGGTGGGGTGGGAAGSGGGASGAASTGGSSGAAAPYPPATDDGGCGCRTTRGDGGAGAWLLAALALLAARRVRT